MGFVERAAAWREISLFVARTKYLWGKFARKSNCYIIMHKKWEWGRGWSEVNTHRNLQNTSWFLRFLPGETRPSGPSRCHSPRCGLNLSDVEMFWRRCAESPRVLRVPPALVTPEWRPAPPARLQAPLQPAACLEVNEISIIDCSSCLFIVLWEWTPTAKQKRRPGLREKAADGSRERPMPLQYTDTRPLGLSSGDPKPLGVTKHQVAGPGGGRLLVEPESRLRCSLGGGWQLGSTVLEKMRITIFFFFF